MTFPTVRAVGANYISTDATSHVIDMPDSIVAGNLLIAFFAHDDESSQETVTWPSGANDAFTQFLSADADATSAGANVAYRIANGSEPATITVTTSTAETATAKIFEIQNWHGTTPPEAAAAGAASGNPDPPSLSPGWGAADTFWIAGCFLNGGSGVWTYPANYTTDQYSLVTGGAGACGLGLCSRQLNAASDDPASGAFTNSGYGSFTIAVRPAGGAPPADDLATKLVSIPELAGTGDSRIAPTGALMISGG